MQSLFTRRRVESRWNGDEGFRVSVGLDGRRGDVRGDCGGVRAEFEQRIEHAKEEACDDVVEESGDASCDDSSSRCRPWSGDEADLGEEGCGAREGSAEAY